eukprot:TRINITY_DN101688_c0_g1_i1.p1 TRINITY_DN101688_c0_g1~~TRINITY_DN101688_c0_g1_i1.p1  ORF type:complete len:310 (-),score=74.97 TRINITY_DN101688_c0_g1_i1:52-981(-)
MSLLVRKRPSTRWRSSWTCCLAAVVAVSALRVDEDPLPFDDASLEQLGLADAGAAGNTGSSATSTGPPSRVPFHSKAVEDVYYDDAGQRMAARFPKAPRVRGEDFEGDESKGFKRAAERRAKAIKKFRRCWRLRHHKDVVASAKGRLAVYGETDIPVGLTTTYFRVGDDAQQEATKFGAMPTTTGSPLPRAVAASLAQAADVGDGSDALTGEVELADSDPTEQAMPKPPPPAASLPALLPMPLSVAAAGQADQLDAGSEKLLGDQDSSPANMHDDGPCGEDTAPELELGSQAQQPLAAGGKAAVAAPSL